jgi:hypothetical protein
MKVLKTTLLLVVLPLRASRGNAQQCGTPSASLSGSSNITYACPASGGGNPYILEPITKTRTYNFTCTADANVSPPPNPGTVYWSYNGSTVSGFGETYCNYSSPYSTYACPPFTSVNISRASSPTAYNQFYNQAYSYAAVSGSCPQRDFVQDFKQCNGVACSSAGTGGSRADSAIFRLAARGWSNS